MNVSYTNQYSNVMVANVGDLIDVVVSYYCIVTGIDADTETTVSSGFTVTLPSSDPDNFTPFDSLTPQILDNWTRDYGNLEYYHNQVFDGINNILNPPLVLKQLPFQ